MTSTAYTWISVDGQLHRVGALEWSSTTLAGRFTYDPAWEALPWAFALDPKNLPMGTGTITITDNDGIPGVLADAGPDRWGRYAIQKLSKDDPSSIPGTEFGWLLHPAAVGTGALRFSAHKDAPPTTSRPPLKVTLEQLHEAAALIAEGGQPPPPMIQLMGLLAPSGGHRPKAILPLDDAREVIAKFEKTDDYSFNVPKVEAACLKAARLAGIDAVTAKAVPLLKGRTALLIERFDRDGAGHPIHYASARSLLNAWRINAATAVLPPGGQVTYVALAALCRHLGIVDRPQAIPRLMAFNYMIGNTDDHFQNVGFLCERGTWRLAPAFDLLPGEGDNHTPGIGPDGRLRRPDNLTRGMMMFGLGVEEVAQILLDARNAAAALPDLLRAEQVSAGQIDFVMGRVSQLAKNDSDAGLRPDLA